MQTSGHQASVWPKEPCTSSHPRLLTHRAGRPKDDVTCQEKGAFAGPSSRRACTSEPSCLHGAEARRWLGPAETRKWWRRTAT